MGRKKEEGLVGNVSCAVSGGGRVVQLAFHGHFPARSSEQPVLTMGAHRTLGCKKKRHDEPEEGSQPQRLHPVK